MEKKSTRKIIDPLKASQNLETGRSISKESRDN